MDVWQWTLTKEAIAPCFVRDVLDMRGSGTSLPFCCSPQLTNSPFNQTPTFSGSVIHLVAPFSSSAWSSPFKYTTSVPSTPVSHIYLYPHCYSRHHQSTMAQPSSTACFVILIQPRLDPQEVQVQSPTLNVPRQRNNVSTRQRPSSP